MPPVPPTSTSSGARSRTSSAGPAAPGPGRTVRADHAGGAAAARPGDDGGRRLIVHLLERREGEVTIDTAANGGKTRTEELPPFELTAIGVKQGGATPAEVGRIVLGRRPSASTSATRSVT